MKEQEGPMRRIILPHRCQKTPSLAEDHLHYEIDAPKICPLCGSSEVVGEIPVLNALDVSGSTVKPAFIKVWVCNDHFKFKRISQNQIPRLILLFSIGLIPLLLFHWVALLLGSFGIITFMVTDIERLEKFSKKFKDKIIFEHFSHHSVISSNQNAWFEKFAERNPGIEFRGDLKRAQRIESLFKHIFMILTVLLWVTSWILIFSIEIGFQEMIIPFAWITLSLLGVLFWLGIFWDLKRVRIKETLYFGCESHD